MNAITNTGNTALMSFIERAAINPEFDVAKFGELLRLQRDEVHDQSRRAFNQGMAEAQSEMLPVVRDAKNTHLGNKYAKLETIDAAMRPIYTKHGFSVRFGSAPAPTEGYIRITCTVAHAGGYFEENYLDAPIANLGAQGGRTATTGVQAVGSAVTYLRRYLLGMVFNIVLADEDDDGEAMRRPVAQRPAAPQQPRDPLDEPDGMKWLVNFEAATIDAADMDQLAAVRGHPSVTKALAGAAPIKIRTRMNEMLRAAAERLAPTLDGQTPDDGSAMSDDAPDRPPQAA
jgi:hypothetical protein